MTVKQAALGRLDGLQKLRAAGRGCRIDFLCRRIVGHFSGHCAADRGHWFQFSGHRIADQLPK
jgi:hypothetical protein